MANASIPLSQLFRNPVLREAFDRAERDGGMAMAVPAPHDPNLIGSAGASLKWRMQLEGMRA